MKRILLLCCFAIALGMVGCYEDKGSYDYKALPTIMIDSVSASYSLVAEDTLRIEPSIHLDMETEVGLKYRWTMELDSVIGTGKDLEYIIPVDAPKEMRLVLTVTDTISQMESMQQVIVRVSSLYVDAFLILSEKNGVSSLSCLKRVDAEYDRMIYDIYENVEGESLTGKPVQIHLHDLGVNTDKHVMLLQDDFSKCMDLDANSMGLSLELSKEFQEIPADMKPKQVFYGDWFSYLLDEDGRMFSRKNFSSEAFHTGYFSAYPMVFSETVNGEEVTHQLKVDRFVYDMNDENGYVFVYEKEANRFLYLRSSSSYGTIGIPQCAVYPAGFVPLDDLGEYELIASSGYWWNDYYIPAGGLFNILKAPDGSYVAQMFHTDDPENIEAVSQRRFYSAAMNDDIMLIMPDDGKGRFPSCPYSFIATGNELYYFSKDGDDDITLMLYYTFPAKITAMEDEFYSNEYLCVGLENGEVYLLRINADGFASEENRLAVKMDQNVGPVKQIIYNPLQ